MVRTRRVFAETVTYIRNKTKLIYLVVNYCPYAALRMKYLGGINNCFDIII